jgi:uncharacterized protein DUF1259
MNIPKRRIESATVAVAIVLITLSTVYAARAQETPSHYQQVLQIVGKSGDFKSNVLKVNIPRNDVDVKIAGYSVPTPFGFGGWFALTKGDRGEDVMMGDLVLTQDEVNPVMSSLLEHLTLRPCTTTSSGKNRASSSCMFMVTEKPLISRMR